MNQLKGKTNSTLYNENLLEIKKGLEDSFSNSSKVIDKLENHKKLNNSIVENMKRNMISLTDKIESLSDTTFKLSNNYIYKESFRDNSSFETDLNYYTDKRGVLLDSSYIMNFDKINQCLTMPTYFSINKLLNSNGYRLCNLEITKQLGSGLINIKNPNNDILKAIDTSLDTFWEETILAVSPIRISLDEYNHYFGALCELTISFNYVTACNEIILYPFGNFPLNINSIKFYLGDNKISEITNNNFMIDKETSIKFSLLNVDKIVIVLNQKHYIRNAFCYDIADKHKNEIWFTSNEELFLSIPYEGVYSRKLFKEPSFLYFNEQVKPLFTKRELDIEDYLFPDSKIVNTTKYEYTYGLYHLEVKENNYKNIGIYVSKPIEFINNIGQITFESNETVVNEDTIISYYLNFGDDIWHEVYSGTTLLVSELMKQSIKTETFLGTVGNSITLSKKPIISSKDKTNCFIEVNLKKDGIVTKAIDVTNYKNISMSYLNLNSNSSETSFYFYQNKIHFNKVISKDTIIEVTYKFFVDSVRVKVIFERLVNKDNSISPTLNNYTITMKAIM